MVFLLYIYLIKLWDCKISIHSNQLNLSIWAMMTFECAYYLLVKLRNSQLFFSRLSFSNDVAKWMSFPSLFSISSCPFFSTTNVYFFFLLKFRKSVLQRIFSMKLFKVCVFLKFCSILQKSLILHANNGVKNNSEKISCAYKLNMLLKFRIHKIINNATMIQSFFMQSNCVFWTSWQYCKWHTAKSSW